MRFVKLYNLESHLLTQVEHETHVKLSLRSLGSASIQPRKSHLKVNVPLLVRISCTICRNKRLVHTVISCQFSRLIGVQSQTCQSCRTCLTCYVVPSCVAASRVVPSSSVNHQGIWHSSTIKYPTGAPGSSVGLGEYCALSWAGIHSFIHSFISIRITN